MSNEYWLKSMTDDFIKLFDSKYDRIYHGNIYEWSGIDQIMKNAVICGNDKYFDQLMFEYRLYRHIAAAMRTGTYDNHKDTFIIFMAAAFYVLEVKGTDRYIEPVLQVLSFIRDDMFFSYRKRDWNEYVFTAAQIVGTQATAYALDKLDIVENHLDIDFFEL